MRSTPEEQRRHDTPREKRTNVELTDRELEVLCLIAQGETTKSIAERLNRSIKTVGSHRENLMRKLDIHNVAGLTRYAIHRGLLDK